MPSIRMNLKDKKILLTGGTGFLGTHVLTAILAHGVPRENIFIPRSQEFDLRELENCKKAVAGQDIVIHLAAKAGGIGFNRERPGECFYDNLLMGTYMIEAARLATVKKFVAIGSICCYPKITPVPFKEDDLWNGYPEETNAPYGLAKKMMLVQAQAYRQQYGFNAVFLMPVNLYGPGDKFDPKRSHVIPALIRKIDEAQRKKEAYIEVWGTGAATREFLYGPDAAEAIVLATEQYEGAEPVNIGAGRDISIKDLTALIADLMGFTGEIRWQHSEPDGQPRRLLDTTRAEREFGFKATTSFRAGLKETIQWYNDHRLELTK